MAAGDVVIGVGGDIACPPGKRVDAAHCNQANTGAVIAAMAPTFVLPLGDTQYDTGSTAEYMGSYDTTGWGGSKAISRPAAGNHEYRTAGATGYYGYFGANAGDPQKGYYSWDATLPWRQVAHDRAEQRVRRAWAADRSRPAAVPARAQESWLRLILPPTRTCARSPIGTARRFSSSTTTPSSTTYTAFWNDLYGAGVDIVLNGHAHDYERFDPQTVRGCRRLREGPCEFVVGTGGEDFQSMGARRRQLVRSASNSASGP